MELLGNPFFKPNVNLTFSYGTITSEAKGTNNITNKMIIIKDTLETLLKYLLPLVPLCNKSVQLLILE